MKVVVITGSTRGIGFGLANSFLARGCAVCISGRTQNSVNQAIERLNSVHKSVQISGFPCDVTRVDQVQALWDQNINHHGKIDIWVNNAGMSNSQMEIWECSPGEVKTVIETSLLGAIYGSMVAVAGFLIQGGGSLYNMEGMGSDGRTHHGLALYGTAKYGLHYFTKALVKETRGKPVVIGFLRPGMVITDMITDQYKSKPEEWEKAKRIFNIIADRVENVSPVLVEGMLNNVKTGKTITYLPRWKLMVRFITAPLSKRDVFAASKYPHY